MAELKHLFNCNYCGATYTLRFSTSETTSKPEFCCFCGESSFDSISREDVDDEDLDDSYEDNSDGEEYND